MDLAVRYHQAAAAGIRQTHAHAGVLHGAGQSHVLGLIVVGLHCLQSLHQARLGTHNLTVGQLLPRTDGVAVADLPGGDADLVGHLVHQALDRKAGLGHAEAPEGAGGGIIGVPGVAINLEILVIIGTGRMGAGPLQHRAAQRGISAGIGDDGGLDALDDAVFVTTQSEIHIHGVTLGMNQNALSPGQLHLAGPAGQIGNQGA